MNAFPVRYIDGVWCVLIDDTPMQCSSKDDAALLAQIPVQHALIHADSPKSPDRRIVEAIIKVGDDYGLMTMSAFRRLRTWLERQTE